MRVHPDWGLMAFIAFLVFCFLIGILGDKTSRPTKHEQAVHTVID